jgi:hypothetical protein
MSHGVDVEALAREGFSEVSFVEQAALVALQALVAASFPCPPTEWHLRPASFEEHIALVARTTDAIAKSSLVPRLVRDNIALLLPVFGPSVDVQTVPHLRVSRPSVEGDFVDWHRDTFYGNMPSELNLWFPLFPIREGAGLRLLPGSHLERSAHVREAVETNADRRTVERGSAAARIGYTYLPKIDDTIATLDVERTRLLAPKLGGAVLFFGHMVHRAQNASPETRVSIDTRIKSSHAPTGTKPGYYTPLCRGPIETCASRLQGGEEPAP